MTEIEGHFCGQCDWWREVGKFVNARGTWGQCMHPDHEVYGYSNPTDIKSDRPACENFKLDLSGKDG